MSLQSGPCMEPKGQEGATTLAHSIGVVQSTTPTKLQSINPNLAKVLIWGIFHPSPKQFPNKKVERTNDPYGGSHQKWSLSHCVFNWQILHHLLQLSLALVRPSMSSMAKSRSITFQEPQLIAQYASKMTMGVGEEWKLKGVDMLSNLESSHCPSMVRWGKDVLWWTVVHEHK